MDRLWPRGMKKGEAHIDEWLRDISPSDELRKWFSHDPAKWRDFRTRYRKELRTKQDLVEKLRDLSRRGVVTLLFAAKDLEHNNALAIKEVLEETD